MVYLSAKSTEHPSRLSLGYYPEQLGIRIPQHFRIRTGEV